MRRARFAEVIESGPPLRLAGWRAAFSIDPDYFCKTRFIHDLDVGKFGKAYAMQFIPYASDKIWLEHSDDHDAFGRKKGAILL